MTDIDRYLRSLGISLLVHGILAGTALWIWGRPPEKPKPEQVLWEVSLFGPARKAPIPPAPLDRIPPPPELPPEPTVSALPQLSPPPAPANPGQTSSAAAAPAFDLPKLTLPTGGGNPGALAIPVSGVSNGLAELSMTGGNPGGRAPGAPDSGAGDMRLSPIVRIPPAYPLEARRQKIEGWVRMEFTVREDGTVDGIKVKGAQPVGVFEQAATAAIAQWKFTPALENGKPIRKRAAQTLKFELNR